MTDARRSTWPRGDAEPDPHRGAPSGAAVDDPAAHHGEPHVSEDISSSGSVIGSWSSTAKSAWRPGARTREPSIAGFVGGFAAIGALVGAGAVAVRNASLQRAARDETMDVCLRPAALSATYGPEHPQVAASLHALAFRYYRVGDLATAEPLARALAIQEKHLGLDAPEMATILDDYASILRRTGRAAEGEALEQRARAIRWRR